jgi:hypothetical protein
MATESDMLAAGYYGLWAEVGTGGPVQEPR